MNNYEKIISVKTVWLIFVRRYIFVILIFASVAFGTLVYTQGFMKKTYSSSITFTSNSSLNQTEYSNAINQIKKEETITDTVQRLANNEPPILVTSDFILSGLSFISYNASSPNIITFSFSSTNKSIVKPIISELAKASINSLYEYGYTGFSSSEASNVLKTSKDTVYLWVGLGIGAALALSFAFVYEIISDEVYDKDDIEKLGCSGFEFTVSK